MATYTKSLTQNMTAHETLVAAWAEYLADTGVIQTSPPLPVWNFPRTLSQNLTAHQSDAEKYIWGRTIAQAMKISLTQAENTTYHVVDARVIKLAAALIRAFPVALSQNLTAHQASTVALGLTVLQHLKLIPVHTSQNHYHLALTQALLMNSALARFFGLTLTQIVDVHASLSRTYVASPVLSQALTAHAALKNTLVLQFNDVLDLSPAEIVHMIYRGDALLDTINMTGLYISPNGTVTTWAINTRTNAVTEYTNYAFNSFAPMGLKYVAASATGIYELDGDTDAGVSITADVLSGLLQMGGGKLAGLKGVYLAVRGGGQFFLKLIAGDGREYVYSVVGQPGSMTTKVNVGKGLRTRYLAFELTSAGQDFNLDALEFVPMLSDRRV